MRIDPDAPIAPPDPEADGAVQTISRRAVVAALLVLTALLVLSIALTATDEKDAAREPAAERAPAPVVVEEDGRPTFLERPPEPGEAVDRPLRTGVKTPGAAGPEAAAVAASDTMDVLRRILLGRIRELQEQRTALEAEAEPTPPPGTPGPSAADGRSLSDAQQRYRDQLARSAGTRPVQGGAAAQPGAADERAGAVRSSPIVYEAGGQPGRGARGAAGGPASRADEVAAILDRVAALGGGVGAAASAGGAAFGEGVPGFEGAAPVGAGGALGTGGAARQPIRMEHPLTPYAIQAGTVIPAVLETEVNSDFAGGVRARIARDVYDTRLQQHLLVPKGSVVVGSSGSAAQVGQSRMAVVWDRLLFPDGRSMTLGALETKDARGASGVPGAVDNHYFKIFTNAFLVSAIGAGVGIATYDAQPSYFERPSPGAVVGGSVAEEMGSVSSELLRRGMHIPPTITLPAGQPFHIFVQRDMAFEAPYAPSDGVLEAWH